MFVVAFIYADDITLLAPTNIALTSMLQTCTKYAYDNDITFNSAKTKCMFFNKPGYSIKCRPIVFMDNHIDFISSTVLLGVNLSDNIFNKHISNTVRNFYCRSNELLFDFSAICYDLKSRLMSTYCMDLYGSSLWNFRKHDDVEEFYVAWRKVIRRLWKLPNTTHCNLLHTIIIVFPLMSYY